MAACIELASYLVMSQPLMIVQVFLTLHFIDKPPWVMILAKVPWKIQPKLKENLRKKAFLHGMSDLFIYSLKGNSCILGSVLFLCIRLSLLMCNQSYISSPFYRPIELENVLLL